MYIKRAAGGKERVEWQWIGRRAPDGIWGVEGEESLADRLQSTRYDTSPQLASHPVWIL